MSKKINKKTSEVKAHSEFGGSQAERIMNCPGSVILSRGIPNRTNPSANRGTAAHACLEFIVNNRDALKSKASRKKILAAALEMETPIEEDGEVIEVVQWDEDMVNDALNALTWIQEQVSPNGVIHVETRLDTSAFTTDDQSSTLDIGIANYSARELIIADYKYGKYKVKVKNNSQLIYYALGLLIKLKAFKKFDRVRLVIIQPNSTGKTITEHTMSVDACIKWGKKFRKVVKVALRPKAPLKYGEKYCFFCLAKKKCPVMKGRMAAKDFK
jgi:hypothetical protein